MDEKTIKKLINDNETQELVLYCKSLPPDEYARVARLLTEKLSACSIPEESGKRNKLALALGELEYNEAVPHIVELLKKDSGSMYIGTLVYALQSLECADFLEDIFHLLYAGNYEVRRNMFALLEMNIDKLPQDMLVRMKAGLAEAIDDYKDRLLGLYIAQDELFD